MSAGGTGGALIYDFFWAASMGFVRGVTPVSIVGKASNVQTVQPPITIGFGAALQGFATSAESWEIVSSSANDAAAGTGARTVAIQTLSDTYLEQTDVVTLNGLTAVPLPRGASYFRHQQTTVLSAGSGTVNAGQLTIRVASGGATRGIVVANQGLSRQASYTTPAGKVAYFKDVIVISSQSGGSSVSAVVAAYFHEPTGVVLLGLDSTYTSGSSEAGFNVGFAIPEKVTTEFRITSVSNNGVDVSLIVPGVLTTLANTGFGQAS